MTGLSNSLYLITDCCVFSLLQMLMTAIHIHGKLFIIIILSILDSCWSSSLLCAACFLVSLCYPVVVWSDSTPVVWSGAPKLTDFLLLRLWSTCLMRLILKHHLSWCLHLFWVTTWHVVLTWGYEATCWHLCVCLSSSEVFFMCVKLLIVPFQLWEFRLWIKLLLVLGRATQRHQLGYKEIRVVVYFSRFPVEA